MLEDKNDSSSISLSKESFSNSKTKDHKSQSISDIENLLTPLANNTFIYFKNKYISLSPFILPAQNLFFKNKEFKVISILLFCWILLTLFEFFYALIKAENHIISDAFFNSFKTISFFMSCMSILFTHLYSSNKEYITKRIELISALCSSIFLVIVSVHMLLLSLHILTEEHIHHVPYNFLKIFYICKSIINIITLLILSEYILHPSVQIKLQLWKICKSWKNLDEYNFDQIKKSKQEIKQWNNHYENMNALCSCLISDLITSILFIMYFSAFMDSQYAIVHTTISILNFIIVIILSGPLLNSALDILMQGKSMIYDSVLGKIEREITYFDGCLGIKDKKFWMTGQNEIRSYIKIYAQKNIDRQKLKENLHKICEEVQLNCDFTLEITE